MQSKSWLGWERPSERLGLTDASPGLRRVLRGIRQYSDESSLYIHTPISCHSHPQPPAKPHRLNAGRPEVPASSLRYARVILCSGASNKRPLLGSVDKIRHPRGPRVRSKKSNAGHRRQLAPDMYLLFLCAQDRAAWTAFSVALIAQFA